MDSLLTTPIIPHQADQLWQELPSDWQGPKALILLCRPQPAGAPATHMLHELAQRACGFQEADYQILEVPAGQITPWSQLKATFHPDYVLLFGIAPAELGIQAHFTFNFPNRFGGAVFVPTSDAAIMAGDKNLKNELWTKALKGLFQK